MCGYLSLISLFNTKPIMSKNNKIISCILYITDSDLLMKKITEKHQDTILTKILLDNIVNKGQSLIKITNDNFIPEFILNEINYISQINFTNERTGSDIKINTLSNEKLKFINKIIYMDYMNQFINFNLYFSLINDNSMIRSIIRQTKKYFMEGDIEIMCDAIVEYEVPKRIKTLVDKLTKMLLLANSPVKLRNDLKLCNELYKFKNYLLKHFEKSEIDITDGEIYEATSNNWTNIKYLIEFNLIREIKKNKKQNDIEEDDSEEVNFEKEEGEDDNE